MSPTSFLNMMGPVAQPICQQYGVRTSVCLAQAAWESGWGDSVIGSSNYFGMKWNGSGNYIESSTQEEENGVMVNTTAKFQDFASLSDAITAYCQNLTTNSAYASAIANNNDLNAYVTALGSAYATSSSYSDNIMTLINEYNLSQYDTGTKFTTISASGTSGSTSSANGTTGSSNSNPGKHNNADPIGILSFAGFSASLAFQEALRAGFESSTEKSLHEFLSDFMARFYHSLYYIPTLPNNKVIVCKPETLFVDPPSCNILYPCMKSNSTFGRSAKTEPTRILLLTDPVAKLFGSSAGNDLYNIATLVYVDYADSTKTTSADALTTRGFHAINTAMQDAAKPMGIISTYEQKNGVRILRTSRGADIYLFLMSEQNKVTAGKTTTSAQVVTPEKDKEKIATVMKALASYELLRARYQSRPGSFSTYFNPYVVPGFPLGNIEDPNGSTLNVHSYVTNVTHQIDETGWSTQIDTNGTHIYPEPKPPNFPIIEDEYAKNIDTTYSTMLGPSVTPIVGDAGLSQCASDYSKTAMTVTEAYKKIWRPLTTMGEHIVQVLDNPSLNYDDNGILTLTGSFFRSDIQSKLVAYATNIKAGTAYNNTDL